MSNMRELSFRRRPESMDAVLQRHDNVGQHGSALVYVFVGIALFGVLMFIFSRGGSQNSTSLTTQTDSISASSIINESRILESAVQKLLGKGCSESEISFDIPPYTANPNTNAPVDKTCHVFHTNGGKVSSSALNLNWKFSSNALFPNAGTAAGELGAYLDGISSETCQKMNELLKNGLTLPSFSGAIYTATYAGSFTASPVSLTPATDIQAGCTLSDTHTPATYFKALIIR